MLTYKLILVISESWYVQFHISIMQLREFWISLVHNIEQYGYH